MRCLQLPKLAETLKGRGIYDISLAAEERNLIYYHYQKQNDIYFLFNTSLSETIETTVSFREKQMAVVYEGMKDCYYPLKQKKK